MTQKHVLAQGLELDPHLEPLTGKVGQPKIYLHLPNMYNPVPSFGTQKCVPCYFCTFSRNVYQTHGCKKKVYDLLSVSLDNTTCMHIYLNCIDIPLGIPNSDSRGILILDIRSTAVWSQIPAEQVFGIMVLSKAHNMLAPKNQDIFFFPKLHPESSCNGQSPPIWPIYRPNFDGTPPNPYKADPTQTFPCWFYGTWRRFL